MRRAAPCPCVVDRRESRGEQRPLDARRARRVAVPVLVDPAGRQAARAERLRCAPPRGGTAASSGCRRSPSRRARAQAGRWPRRDPARGPCSFAMRLSYSGGNAVARLDARCRRGRPGPDGITHRPTRPGVGAKARDGSSAAMRTSIACPVRRRGARGRREDASPSGSPAAMRSCSRTMSTPDTSSVTPCSTWSRVFTSRNQKSPSGSRRNSAVAALRSPAASASRTASAMEMRGAATRRGPARAPPRRASGADAGSSSRARPARRPRRTRRQAAGPRRGAPGSDLPLEVDGSVAERRQRLR